MNDLITRETNGTVAVPNGTIASKFDDLVERYRRFARKSAENIIKLAETLIEAKHALGDSEMTQFCEAVGLEQEGSTYRKLIKIGKESSRFEPFLDRTPSNWTTVYKLATLPPDQFEQVTKDDRFGHTMTAAEIKLITSDTTNRNARMTPDFAISLNGLNDPTTQLEVARKLEELSEQYGCEYRFSSNIRRLRKQNPPNFSHLTDSRHEGAGPADLSSADPGPSLPGRPYEGEAPNLSQYLT